MLKKLEDLIKDAIIYVFIKLLRLAQVIVRWWQKWNP